VPALLHTDSSPLYATFLTAGGTLAHNRGQNRDAFLAPHLQAL
jgi:hypothetical protein